MKALECQWRQQHGRLSYLEGFLFPPNGLEVHAGTQAPLNGRSSSRDQSINDFMQYHDCTVVFVVVVDFGTVV